MTARIVGEGKVAAGSTTGIYDAAIEFGTQHLVAVPGFKTVWVPSRAITLHQPWAYLMTAVPDPWRKDIENRPTGFTSINFRGPVWVHAGAKLSRAVYEKALAAMKARSMLDRYIPAWADVVEGKLPGLARSAIVGSFVIDDYLRPTPAPVYSWHFPHTHGFRTRDARSVDPVIACGGHLGFWRIPPDVAIALARRTPI
jgi:hypothetical protein